MKGDKMPCFHKLPKKEESTKPKLDPEEFINLLVSGCAMILMIQTFPGDDVVCLDSGVFNYHVVADNRSYRNIEKSWKEKISGQTTIQFLTYAGDY
jgi:hypothetical protein